MIIQKNIIKSSVVLFLAITIILISYMIPIKNSDSYFSSKQEQVVTAKSADKIEIQLKHQ